MALSDHAIACLIKDLSTGSNLDRSEATLVVETAHHAANEAIETLNRICMALGDRMHILIGISVASKIAEVAAAQQHEAIKDKALRISGMEARYDD